jgi:quercetin dioxygenase-like cupin family protein
MWRLAVLAPLLAGCATVGIERGDDQPALDPTLAAIEGANVRNCPNGRTLEGANHEAFGPQHGVEITDIAIVVSADQRNASRLRRIVVQPGGVIAWHDHRSVQGAAFVLSGQMTEIRNSCMDPIVYRAGDVAIEDVNTAHGWRNDGDTPAVVLVSHVVPRS